MRNWSRGYGGGWSSRDIRITHPFDAFTRLPTLPQTTESGDMLARAQLRRQEVETSIDTFGPPPGRLKGTCR